MKISVIGAGVQGSTIAFFLAKNPQVAEVVCSDISLDRARRLARNLGSRKISAQKVDASNADDLSKVIKGADTVINASLPKYNLKIMDAALKNGTHYVDLATDIPVKTNILKELALSPRWKEAQLTAVINQGGPFVMNVLVRHAADRLDKVDAIRLRFGWKNITKEKEHIPIWEPRWSPEVALEEWTPDPVIYEDGKFKNVPQFSGIEEYKFPAPVGSVTLCFIEYEPVLTLPRFIGKGVKYVDCKITLEPIVATLHKIGLASDKPIEVKGAKVAPKDVLLALISSPVESEDKIATGKVDFAGCYLAQVEGEKANEKITHTMYTTYTLSKVYKKFKATWAEVAIPAMITATMLAKGEIKIKGVIPPEGLEPEPFLAKLANVGISFHETITREKAKV